MEKYWVEVAHVPGIVRSHTAKADNPCEAARIVLEAEYGIESWECVPDITGSTSRMLMMYADPIPTGDEYRHARHPEYRPLKVYVHGQFGER